MVTVALSSLACMPSGEGTAPIAVSPVATATSAATRPGGNTPPAASGSPAASGTVVRTAGPAASGTPGTPAATSVGGTPAATPNTAGRAITVGDVQQAWASKSISYQATAGAPAASGFSVPGSPLTLTKGGQSVDVVVFVYPNQGAADADWTLGNAPAPKPGKTLGTFAAVWWNENVVMVLRERVGGVTDDARDAFLGLGGPPPATPAPGAPTSAASTSTPAPAGSTMTATPTAITRTVTPTAPAATPPPSAATATPTPATAPPTPPAPR